MADRCVTVNKCCKRVSGKISLRRYDECCGTGPEGKDPFPYIFVGNAKELIINASLNEITQKDYTSPVGGDACSDNDIQSVEVSFTSLCNSNANLAKQLAAQLVTVPAATNKVFTGVIRAEGSVIPFKDANGNLITGVIPSSVTIVSPTTLVLNSDYTINGNGITILENAPNINVIPLTGILIEGTLNHAAHSLAGFGDQVSVEYSLFFDGQDKQGNAESFEVHRIKFSPGGAKYLTEGFSEANFSGKALIDNCRNGTTQNKYATFAI